MPPSSPFRRPEWPASGFTLQPRDKAIIRSVFAHRVVRSDHVRDLLFANTSMRVVQVRLRKLWEHRYLARYFLSKIFGVPEPAVVRPGQPIYGLDEAGASLLAESDSEKADALQVSGNIGKFSLTSLEHHLIAADFLIAVELACTDRQNVRRIEVESEPVLWRKLCAWKAAGNRGRSVISDGAFTIVTTNGDRLTFHVEVVRADVKGGNKRLIDKLALYATLLREGFFKKAYGHDHVRAVIVATTSCNRADNLRELARTLVHGRRLFWFGAYQTKDADGRNVSTINKDTILAKRWDMIDSESLSLGEAAAASSRSPAPYTPPATSPLTLFP
ncbi:MAG: replication-relaxation family protein [Bacilli bacterium]